MNTVLTDNNLYIYELKKKPIVIFTASSAGIRVYHILSKYGLKPIFFCDNNANTLQKSIINVPVITIEKLKELIKCDEYNIIIATKVYYYPIYKQLIHLEIPEYCIYNHDIEQFILTGIKTKPYEFNIPMLKQYQMAMLNIMLLVHDICEKNSLTYYLYAGTLLGAIRHNGFIPWDDDFDIIMPRSDYEKLFIILKNAKLKNINITEPFKNSFKDDILYRISQENDLLAKRVYIDIFPLDNMKNKYNAKNNIQEQISLFIVNAIKQKNELSLKSNILIKILSKINLEMLIKLHLYICTFYNKKATNFYFIFSHLQGGIERDTIRKDLYINKTLHNFEGYQLWIPTAWDEILTKKYGNYMTLPPENYRF